ncbi:MAG: 16S rRNA (uracil(1498)-N(3))-methyltransferase [Elusimicrobia bacterium]|nr:16S rRNA (uracil(1498)-N(3))-methyltransferase [Elusimicrobiota bacterium]
MPHFFISPDDLRGGRFSLSGPEAFHIVKVLRYERGGSLTLFDGKGGRFEGLIEDIAPDGTVSGRISSRLAAVAAGAPARLNLYLGLLKASHWDYALEKGTELGVSSFVPVLTPRTVVLLHEVERAKSKQERWARLIMAAAKQCGRADLPPVADPVQFRDAIRALKDKGLLLLAWEGKRGSLAAEALAPALSAARARQEPLEISLFIGPEGGFSEEEVQLAEAEGAVVFGLGPRILRAETAAITAAALVQYELGGL